MSTRDWLIIGAIVLVLIGSYLWNRNRTNQDLTGEVPAAEEIITQQNGKVVKKVGDTIQELTSEEIEAQQKEINEKVVNATVITLKAVENQQGSGTSARTVDNGTYYQKITVEGMTPLNKGSYYEGWLERGDGSRISVGRVEMNNTSGRLLYSSKEDRSDYNNVIVSRKAENGQPDMGERVLEGNF